MNYNRRVQVYRNLHTGNFSVRQNGKVIDHVDTITLQDVRYLVQPAGHAKVLRERRKNVHAFVTGYPRESLVQTEKKGRLRTPIRYNPYEHDYFFYNFNYFDMPIFKSKYCELDLSKKQYMVAWQ